MTMHEAHGTVEWHVIVLLGALVPIGHRCNILVCIAGFPLISFFWPLGGP